MAFRELTPSFRCKLGAGSFGSFTDDLDAKNELNILLCSNGSCIVMSFSTKGGTAENLLFFISFKRMENFFLAEIEGFLRVLFTVLLKADFARRFALEDSFAASLTLS